MTSHDKGGVERGVGNFREGVVSFAMKTDYNGCCEICPRNKGKYLL